MKLEKRCFADKGEYCTALKEKNCKNCKFYRTDLYIAQIEYDIQNYGGSKEWKYTH